jgi:hypothetical protein
MNHPDFELTSPRCWEPEEALAVWELLNEIMDLIWAQYQIPLMELLAEQRCTCQKIDYAQEWKQLDLFDPNDEIPF